MQILATAVASALLLTPAASFTPSSFLSSPYSSTNNRQYQQVVVPSQISSSSAASTTALSSDLGLAGECLLTPEGYGFSATAERIIAQAKRGNNGFYMATSSSKVIDVMGGITGGTEDVALIYEGTELLGIFTESDYIDVSFVLFFAY